MWPKMQYEQQERDSLLEPLFLLLGVKGILFRQFSNTLGGSSRLNVHKKIGLIHTVRSLALTFTVYTSWVNVKNDGQLCLLGPQKHLL